MANNILSEEFTYDLYIVDTYEIFRYVRVFTNIKELRKFTKKLKCSYNVQLYRVNKDDIKEIYDEIYKN